jgi:hypothetical protein
VAKKMRDEEGREREQKTRGDYVDKGRSGVETTITVYVIQLID